LKLLVVGAADAQVTICPLKDHGSSNKVAGALVKDIGKLTDVSVL